MVLFALFTCQQTALAQTAAQIYFEQTEVSYDIASTEPFVAPTLVNPDGVTVWYTTSDYSILSVGYYDGTVQIFNEGVATITASSSEAGSATYTLTVTDSREGSGISWDVTEMTYDVSTGEEFVAPVLNNPNGVGITYTCSNYSVASIDYKTGAITINGVGETVIGASSIAEKGFKPTTVEFKLIVTDPEIIYNVNFSDGQGGWTEENTQNVWVWNYQGYLYCDGSWRVSELTDSYIVSPEIEFDPAGNVLTFDQMGSQFKSFEEQAHVVAREVGGEWIDCGTIPAPGEYMFTNSGKIRLPEALNGKKAQIAFKYTTDGYDMCGQWYVKNITVKKYIKKEDPQISFDVTEMNYDISETFVAPVLNNPNNVIVEYSTMNNNIASVDYKTGEVKIFGEGDVTIVAKSKESKKYESVEVSYVVHVTDKGKLLTASFFSDLCGFTEESSIGGIWKYYYNYAKADGGQVATEPTNCFLVSPEFALKSNNKFEFEQLPQMYAGQNISDIAKFAIRTSNGDEKGEWTYLALNYPSAEAWSAEKTGMIEIPAEFNNKTVQVAFVYVANGTNWQWWVRNLIVRGIEAAKADPEISFAVGDVEAILGQEFTAPELNNPNNVEVVYSSNKPEVATVDPTTGAITLVGEGFTTITATSVENDQFVSASVNYVLTVKAAGAADIIFEESFGSGLGEFTSEGDLTNVWSWMGGYAHADGYQKGDANLTSLLVSPVIRLKSGNVFSFSYNSQFFAPERVENDMKAAVRLADGEWTVLDIPVCETNGTGVSTGDIAIPAEFNGKDVQIAIRYTTAGSASGVWDVYNFVVKGSAEAQKKDPELAFAADSYEFLFNKSQFEGVELINPYNVEVVYEIVNNDYSVADIEPYTGIVWIYNYGTVVITAKFEGNDEYEADEASYTLNVVEETSTGIEGITAEDLYNGKVYDLQGRKVSKLGKGVFIVNGKKVVVK